MAKINLRPWREEQAKLRQKNFAANVMGVALFAVIIVLGIGYYFDAMKERQITRNNYLKTETAKLDRKIAEIKELKAKRERLLERLKAIQELQGTRPLIVRNFDELVRVLPDGLYYTSLSRKGERVALSGAASDNLEVSSLMRNLDSSIWFGEPSLSNVNTAAVGQKAFNLSVGVTKPKLSDGKDKKGGQK